MGKTVFKTLMYIDRYQTCDQKPPLMAMLTHCHITFSKCLPFFFKCNIDLDQLDSDGAS